MTTEAAPPLALSVLPERLEAMRQRLAALGKPPYLEDMLALLALLDDYICVHNTNIHLMAGIGKTARILIPYPPEWRDMKIGNESPWFKGFKLYRQNRDKSWSQALDDLKRDLSH
jgi:hypothetical protein